MTKERALCQRCGGNCAVPIPGGTMECPACDGTGWDTDRQLSRLVEAAQTCITDWESRDGRMTAADMVELLKDNMP
jgi:hypothetical protein